MMETRTTCIYLILLLYTSVYTSASPSKEQPSEVLRWRSLNRGNNTYEPLAVPSSRRIEMDCRTRGYEGRLTRSWFKDGEPLSRRNHVRIRKGRLIILDSKVGDSGNYSCIVSNGPAVLLHNYVVKVVHRVVAHRPIVKDSLPGNHTVLRGADITLLCDIEYVDILSSMAMAWVRHLFINGSYTNQEDGAANIRLLQNCSIGGSYCDFVRGESVNRNQGASARKLVLRNLQVEDSGLYSCIATDQYGSDLSTGMITVVEELPEVAHLQHVRLMWTTIICITVSLGILLVITGVLYWRAKSSRRKKERSLSVFGFTKQIKVNHDGPNSTENSIAPDVTLKKIRSQPRFDRKTGAPFTSEYEFDVDAKWELALERLSLGGLLGEGNFGKVLKGDLRISKSSLRIPSTSSTPNGGGSNPCSEVAVKMLKEGHTDSDVIDFVKEVEIMKKVGTHENVLSLLGVVTQPSGSHPLWIIVEYAKYGCLKTYLQKAKAEGKPLDSQEMYSFSNQIAKGMRFLSQKKCVHRDLAARNILLAEQNVIKIADFGMARDIIGKEYYRKKSGGKLPIKWMAPEAFFQNFYSAQSDVWSFGILLWEISSYGEQPYREIFDHITLFKKLEEGFRLSKPPDCPPIFYDLMNYCWKYRPEERPTWANLVLFTDDLLSGALDNRYLAVTAETEIEGGGGVYPILSAGKDINNKPFSYYVSPSSGGGGGDLHQPSSRPLSYASGYCDIELYSQRLLFSSPRVPQAPSHPHPHHPFINGYSNNVYGKLLNESDLCSPQTMNKDEEVLGGQRGALKIKGLDESKLCNQQRASSSSAPSPADETDDDDIDSGNCSPL